jgi:DNA-binding CsgD family transcriptional regulator
MSQDASLKEDDYLAILNLIETLYTCKTRSDLKAFLTSELLPMFNFDSALYGWTDPEIREPQLIDVINFPSSMLPTLQEWISGEPVAKIGLTHNRAVVASDVDLDRQEVATYTEEYINRASVSDSEAGYIKNVHAALVMLDLPDLSMGIGFHRSNSNKQLISHKEVRMLELLRPHLLQSTKAIILSEEISSFKALIEDELGKSKTAVALLRGSSRILYRNEKFEDLFPLQPGQTLPQYLIELVEKEFGGQNPPFNVENSQLELPFFALPQGKFRLSVTILKEREVGEDPSLLVRLKPVIEPHVKLNCLLQEKKLTGREMEICILTVDGMINKEIAERLFISPHTVKTHLRQIFKKLDVHTRIELMTKLNKAI